MTYADQGPLKGVGKAHQLVVNTIFKVPEEGVVNLRVKVVVNLPEGVCVSWAHKVHVGLELEGELFKLFSLPMEG